MNPNRTAFPHARQLESDIRAGKVETIDNYWAPFYTIHKQLAGLRDAWVLCGDATAREVLVRLADWCGNLVKDLPDERRAPLLVAATDDELLARIKPVPGRPGTFRTDGLAKPSDVTLAPFYQVHFQRYAVYWRLTDAARAAEHLRRVAEEERLERELDARTIDRVRTGEQQPETDHALKAEKSRTGLGPDGRFFRAAEPDGWFSYELKAPPARTKAALRLLHWGRDPNPEFDLLVDGVPVATVKREAEGDRYLATEHPIDPAGLAGKPNLVVRLQSRSGHSVPPVYDLRVVKAQ